ncbi:CatB-related O-acetyltransferase [Streptococcus troglodytae]|uniref:Chloramphenicol acetyltransferase n=1 Tax=Streptococcus troglodytae TaxID=1111760 RepID=A0A1L7LLQ3_9STRE|nr:CatB-related O-acetyltransferase [Streptococcus troglodytae]BAQ25089.1 acetyltransferase-like protein [Streptococcus troglodytae]
MKELKIWEEIEFPHDTIKSDYVEVGKYTYYAGAYNKGSFAEQSVRYLTEEPNRDKLIIGNFCSIATGVNFNLGGSERHLKEWISTFPFYYLFPDSGAHDGYFPKGDTVIGNDVWIGTDAIIMPGITVGDGAIIGARSVVTKDVEPYTIVGGIPAKTIKKRFSDTEIEKLLDISWWNFDIEDIKKLLPYITSPNIELFIEKASKIKTINEEKHD